MLKISTQGYKGTRDFYPEDMRLQRYIFAVWRKVAKLYGYEEYNGPMIELTDLYRAKTGEEIVNEQTYSFEDRGGRDVTIRPEMTPTVARMVAAREQELAYPLRWYSIPNFWRYERPQKGRLREFWQLNVDLLGVDDVAADVEIIALANDIMREFGATTEMYTIRINDRRLLSLLMGEYLGLDLGKSHLLTKLFDRKAKMPEDAFLRQAEEIVGSDLTKLQQLLSVKSVNDLPSSVIESGEAEALRKLFSELEKVGVANCELDLETIRGLDYYTGVVFELYDTNPDNNRAILAGGRYDELLSIFDKPNVPATGFGAGDAGTYEFLLGHNLLPKLQSDTRVYLVVLGEYMSEANKLAEQLRKQGITVAVDFSSKKAGDQVKIAIKKQISWVVFIGEEEVKIGQFTLKNLKTEEQQKVSQEQLIDYLRA